MKSMLTDVYNFSGVILEMGFFRGLYKIEGFSGWKEIILMLSRFWLGSEEIIIARYKYMRFI